MKFYPIGMQAFVARRLDRVFTSSEVERARDRATTSASPPSGSRTSATASTRSCFRPDPAVRAQTRRAPLRRSRVGPEQGHPHARSRARPAPARRPADARRRRQSGQRGAPLGARGSAATTACASPGAYRREALVRLYRRAALVVVPSRYEGFGLPGGRGDGVRDAGRRDGRGRAARGARGRRRRRARPAPMTRSALAAGDRELLAERRARAAARRPVAARGSRPPTPGRAIAARTAEVYRERAGRTTAASAPRARRWPPLASATDDVARERGRPTSTTTSEAGATRQPVRPRSATRDGRRKALDEAASRPAGPSRARSPSHDLELELRARPARA